MRKIGEIIQVEFSSPRDPFFVLGVAAKITRLHKEMAKELKAITLELEKKEEWVT